MRRKTVTVLALLATLAIMPAAAQAVSVDLELELLVDVSGSIDASEFTLQMQGYANAFNDPVVYSQIAAGNGVAVTLIQWSSGTQQAQSLGWTLLTDQTSSQNFATAILGVARAFTGNTGPGSAINYGAPLFTANGYEGTRLVMDVSGDGTQNSGDSTPAARDAAYAAGITINGLAIGGQAITDWYTANVKTPDGFVDSAADFAAFGDAIDRKIISEVAGPIPEPVTVTALLAGLVGIGGYLRKRRMA